MFFADLFVPNCLNVVSIARDHQAYDSSKWSSYDPKRATDSNIDIVHTTCSHSEKDMNAWWAVDLESNYVVQVVYLLNRNSQGRYIHFNIYN